MFMGKYFKTDGIRGIVNEDLTPSLAFWCGNALSTKCKTKKILIGGDTRTSRTLLTTAFTLGALVNGVNVDDTQIITTPGIAFLTKKFGYDFGVVITASHNPNEYNGINIFDTNGNKISSTLEISLEKRFGKIARSRKFGSVKVLNLKKYYIEHLLSCGKSLKNLKIVLDTANGASKNIAPHVFKKLGAKVITIKPKDEKINKNCGALYPRILRNYVLDNHADFGFSFDGDGDRIVACLKNGKILDGDDILFLLANELKKKNSLNKNTIVGTEYTNMGVEEELKKKGIKLIRTSTGDKNIAKILQKQNLSLGGEQSGHIIISKHETTGDGILCALVLSKILKQKDIFSKLPKTRTIQERINLKLDKVSNQDIKTLIDKATKLKKELKNKAKIFFRKSGTEPVLRFLIEAKDKKEIKEVKSLLNI